MTTERGAADETTGVAPESILALGLAPGPVLVLGLDPEAETGEEDRGTVRAGAGVAVERGAHGGIEMTTGGK